MFPLRDHTPSPRFPFVTIGLIGLNIAVFVLEYSAADLDAFIGAWALVPSRLGLSDPFSFVTFVSSQFLHAGIAHVGFNMWYLWIFGDNVEGRMGHGRFLLFYIFSGIVAALAQLPLLLGSDIPMLGASGAVAGVLGAYWALFPDHRVDTILPGVYARATLPAGVVLFFWFITQLFNGSLSVLGTDTAASGGVAWWAHIGGFVFGWVVGRILRGARRIP